MNILQCRKCGHKIDDDWQRRGKGHICLTCFREYNNAHQKEYYRSHKEQCLGYTDPARLRELANKWYYLNKEHCSEVTREYYQNNKEECKARSKLWCNNNRTKVRIMQARARCRRREVSGNFTPEEWNAKLKEYNYRCAYCGCELNMDTITIDHVIPITRDGTNYIENLVPACQSCNSRKNTKTVIEFMSILIKDNECQS